MLETPDAVVEALRENNQRPYGLHRTVTAEELVDAAEQFEEPDVLVTALLELMSAYEYTGEHRKAPVTFARLLKLWDSSPEAFSRGEVHQLLWRFKWVTTSLLQVPEVPLDAVRGWTEEMRERYRDAGHGMQPVAAMRYLVAAHTGTGADHAHDLWVTRSREELSDCEACETRHRALYHLRAGDDAAALDVWRPVLGGEQGCAEEPFISQAHALLPLLRLGRTDEARSYHLVGYRFARGKSGMAEEVGLHLEFCALSRNEGRGLEILAENRALFDVTGAPLSRLHFLTGAEVLLTRLEESGHADTAVAGPLGRNWTAGTLLARVRDEADGLAAAFDLRNGTTAVSGRRVARVARQPLLAEPLPLGLRTASAVPAPAPAAAREIPDDFVTLVTRARTMTSEGHPGDTAWWERIAERVAADGHAHDPALGPEARLRAELARQRAFAAYEDEHWADGHAAMSEAAELFAGEAAMPWHALGARARVACIAVPASEGTDQEEATEAVGPSWSDLDAVLREAEQLLAAAGDGDGAPADAADAADTYLLILQCRAFAAHGELVAELPEPSEATRERFLALAATVVSEADRLGQSHKSVAVRTYRADAAARAGRAEDAEAELRTALELLDAADRPWRKPRLEAQLGHLLLQRGEPAEAVEHLRRALAGALHHADASFPVFQTHMLLGHACTHSGDMPGAVRHLTEAAARLDREEPDENASAEVRLQLADALARSGQEADAVAILESLVLDEAAAALDERLLAQIRLTLARGLRDLDEHQAAAEQFLVLADAVAGWEEQHTHTLVAGEAAVALARADRWDAARAAYDRALASHRVAPEAHVVAEMTREFALLTMAAEGPDGVEAALAHLRTADGIRAGVPADDEEFAHWYHAGATHYQRGRVLAGAERHQEALAEMERAVAAHEEGGPDGEAPRAEAVRIAALIEANGLERPRAAVTRLDAAIARCEAAGIPHAAKILTGLRDDFAAR
ncbi:hypothetical protein [uncultured Streptomyces sp.]|uniref:hypothetical protein n=1 Tax=uncultured Streptomyces sp. TaxID=174707 RepID=UPI0026255099|nr:hypothetical protein [uncultured Streptomyces sp.]